MKRPLRELLIAMLLAALCTIPATAAQNPIEIHDQDVTIAFPDQITFHAQIESSAEIERVTLEYGVEKLTCGTVTAKAFPDFTPGTAADVSWTWEMLQSGSEPPGARIWYQWRVTDKAGNQRVSDRQQVTWLDDQHPWQSKRQGMLTLHWYGSTDDFAEELLESAGASLQQLERTTGVTPQSPIDLYIYADNADMRDAVLYEPGWTGGQAFPDYDIVIIGISPEQITWGKQTEAHELTHVLVGHLTFSCLGDVPTWLNEGIAVYGEGGLDRSGELQLQAAIAEDELISVRALSGGFSEHPEKADLSYAQSYSLVNFLIVEHGRDRLIKLFGNLSQGMNIEDALNDAYGFGLDGLEDGWRASIGARPRQAVGQTPTTAAPPTPVPTYQPIEAAPVAAPPSGATPAPSQVAAAQPTLPAEPDTASPAPNQPALPGTSVSPVVLVIGFIFLVLIGIGLGIGVLFIATRGRRRSSGTHG